MNNITNIQYPIIDDNIIIKIIIDFIPPILKTDNQLIIFLQSEYLKRAVIRKLVSKKIINTPFLNNMTDTAWVLFSTIIPNASTHYSPQINRCIKKVSIIRLLKKN